MGSSISDIQSRMKKHSPQFFMCVGIAGMVATTILAVKVTPKALILIEQKKAEMNTDSLSSIDTIKAAGVCYIPSILTGIFAIFCLIEANALNARRSAALATAYHLSETAFKEYREKVTETYGARKECSIRDSMAKDEVVRNPVSSRRIIVTGRGTTLCYDTFPPGRYFWSDIEKLRKIVKKLNQKMTTGERSYISLNELYYEIGLPPIPIGDDLGWNVNRGLIDMNFSSQLTEDRTPCLVLGYVVAPEYDFE